MVKAQPTFLQCLSGSVGQVVFQTYGGKVVGHHKAANYNPNPPTPAQVASRNVFRDSMLLMERLRDDLVFEEWQRHYGLGPSLFWANFRGSFIRYYTSGRPWLLAYNGAPRPNLGYRYHTYGAHTIDLWIEPHPLPPGYGLTNVVLKNRQVPVWPSLSAWVNVGDHYRANDELFPPYEVMVIPRPNAGNLTGALGLGNLLVITI